MQNITAELAGHYKAMRSGYDYYIQHAGMSRLASLFPFKLFWLPVTFFSRVGKGAPRKFSCVSRTSIFLISSAERLSFCKTKNSFPSVCATEVGPKMN